MRNIYIFDEYLSSQKNGIGTYLQELIYCFSSLRHNICLVVFNAETEEFKIINEKQIKKILFPPMRGHFVYYVGVIDKLLRLYIEDNSDNIFFINHTPCDDLIESLKTYFPLSKIVFTIHDFLWTMPLMGNLEEFKKEILSPEPLNNIKKESKIDSFLKMYKKEKKMYEITDRIVCLSNDTFSILRNIYEIDENKIFYTSNGLRDLKPQSLNCHQKEEKKKELYLKEEDKILLFIGRPTKQKGIFDLIAALKVVLKYYPNVKLVIIGDGDEVSVKEILRVSSDVASSIIMTGRLNKKAVEKWLSIADIGVIPSYYEQCSYVAIEMMMYGLPIVSSDGLGIRNMFIDGVNAKVAKIGSRNRTQLFQNNITNSIVNLLENSEICKSLSSGAIKTYRAKFAIEHMKDHYRKFIESLYV